jgi:hypothetical protein
MNKSSFQKAFLFAVLVNIFLFSACKKDIAGRAAGVYTGDAIIEPYGAPGITQNFPGTVAEITKLNRTNIRVNMKSLSPQFTFAREFTLNKDGSFGNRVHAPRGIFVLTGEEGRISGDSFTFARAGTDSVGVSLLLTFNGHRN